METPVVGKASARPHSAKVRGGSLAAHGKVDTATVFRADLVPYALELKRSVLWPLT